MVRLDRSQKSFKLSFEEFYARRVGPGLMRRGQQLMRHAALDYGALAYDAAGEVQHSQRAGHRLDRLPVERASAAVGAAAELISYVTVRLSFMLLRSGGD